VTDDRRTFVHQLGRLGAGRIGGAVASAVWFVVVVHHLGPSDVGDLALLLSLGAMFGLLADGGYSIMLQAVVADAPESSASALAAVRRRRLPLGIAAAVLTGSVWLPREGESAIPKRIEAIRLFARSELYYDLTGQPAPTGVELLTQVELDRLTNQIVKP